MLLQITFLNHLKVMWFFLAVTLLLIPLTFFIVGDFRLLPGVGIFIFVAGGPSLIAHIEYWVENAGTIVRLQPDGFWLEKYGLNHFYSADQIEAIAMHKAKSIDAGGIPTNPLELYHYARIKLKSGDEVIITCLMAPDVEKALRVIRGISIYREPWKFSTLFI